jgi:hypothetical protein
VQTTGQRLAEIRRRSGVSVRQLASIARDLGLSWYPNTFPRIEAGSKSLTLEEALLLPLIFERAGVAFNLRDLFDADTVLTAKRRASPQDVADVFAGRLPAGWVEEGRRLSTAVRKRGEKRQPLVETTPYSDAQVRDAIEASAEAIGILGARPRDDFRDLHGEPEQAMARELGAPVRVIVDAARRLWGESVGTIRDLAADELIRRKYPDDKRGPTPAQAVLELSTARRRASTVLRQEIEAALRRQHKPKGRS